MKVHFHLMLDAKDGETSMQMDGELPFMPRADDIICFCEKPSGCCDGARVRQFHCSPRWIYREERFELSLKEDWPDASLQELVEHYLAAGFVEIDKARSMY